MPLSDDISAFIREALMASGGVAEMQRSVLAARFRCAPSQINYVIATRFAPEQGYLVESRRGGGGYIRITRLRAGKRALLMHALHAVGEQIDARSADVFLVNLTHAGVLSREQAAVLRGATGDNALRPLPQPLRDAVRARIFKQCVSTILEGDEPL